MRLFIFNNSRLITVISADYNGEKTLWPLFGPVIEDQLIGNDATKRVLWATAKRNLEATTINWSSYRGKNASQSNQRYTLNKTTFAGSLAKVGPSIDFYLDRSTGWIGIANNYSIVSEITVEQQKPPVIPTTYNAISGGTLPWQESTKEAGDFTRSLVAGKTSLVPIGVGNFYGKSYALGMAPFKELTSISAQLSNAVKAVISVEWYALAFDNALGKDGIGAENLRQEALKTQVQQQKTDITTKIGELDQEITRLEASREALSKQNGKTVIQQLISISNQIKSNQDAIPELRKKTQQLDQDTALIDQNFKPFLDYQALRETKGTIPVSKTKFDQTVQTYDSQRAEMMKEPGLSQTTALIDTTASGWYAYIQRLRKLENYLKVYYRQTRITATSAHFNSAELDKTTKEKAWSYFLYGLGAFSKILGTLSGAFSLSGLPGPGDAKLSAGVGGVAKDLFSYTSEYFFRKQALYIAGGKENSIEETLSNTLDLLTIAYAAYELFLLKWGIAELVTGRTNEQLEKKLIKVKELMKAKSEHAGLPEINVLQNEIDQ